MSVGFIVFWIIWYVVTGIILAVVCDSIAKKKGYTGKMFLVLGFLFNAFTLVAVCALPDKVAADETADQLEKLNKSFTALLEYLAGDEEDVPPPESGFEPRPEPADFASRQENVQPAAFSSFADQEPAPAASGMFSSSFLASRPSYTGSEPKRKYATVILRDRQTVCSECGGAVRLNDAVCPHCGVKFEVSPDSGGLGYTKNINI